MAARGALYAVFLLPVVFSAAFGTAVMADVLQEPDRELRLWGFAEKGHKAGHGGPVEIVGLQGEYSASQPVSLGVRVSDPAFSCGDLYITIYSGGEPVIQRGFFNQCFGQDIQVLPVGAEFSEMIDAPGAYEVVVEVTDRDQQSSLAMGGKFTVK